MQKILKYVLVFLTITFNNAFSSENMQEEEELYYQGYINEPNLEEKIRVEPLISLGGKYVERIRKTIEHSDQFIVCFMYRFNHPGLTAALAEKLIHARNNSDFCMPLVFLDYNPYFVETKKFRSSNYKAYVEYLSQNVPFSFIKLKRDVYKDGNKKFHHKIIICKERSDQAVTFIGSANATYEGDNFHSEDTLMIRSLLIHS